MPDNPLDKLKVIKSCEHRTHNDAKGLYYCLITAPRILCLPESCDAIEPLIRKKEVKEMLKNDFIPKSAIVERIEELSVTCLSLCSTKLKEFGMKENIPFQCVRCDGLITEYCDITVTHNELVRSLQ